MVSWFLTNFKKIEGGREKRKQEKGKAQEYR
jgi:hypothetical protein